MTLCQMLYKQAKKIARGIMGKENQEEWDSRWKSILGRDEQDDNAEQSTEDTEFGEQNENS